MNYNGVLFTIIQTYFNKHFSVLFINIANSVFCLVWSQVSSSRIGLVATSTSIN